MKTGLAGIWEYWSQGCYREYSWAWTTRIADAIYALRQRLRPDPCGVDACTRPALPFESFCADCRDAIYGGAR